MDLVNKLSAMRRYFDTGVTKEYNFRKTQLQKLQRAVEAAEIQIYEALYTDLKKSKEESWVTENGLFLSELKHTIGQLHKWMKPKSVGTNLANLPSKSFIASEPLGVVLIISPWNYPFQLLFMPLIGAMAAGNCVVLKSSEFAPATSAVMKKIIEENFEEQYILFVQGDGAEVVPQMMDNFVFDHVFYTGSTAVGKIIYQAAAKDLVPVTLELGGKSPCVVEEDANIKVAAKRIAFTKFSNAGQMCVAPDYILVHVSQKDKLVEELKNAIAQFFGDAAKSYDYGKIINARQFDRLVKYFDDGKVLSGGRHDREKLFIEPTLIDAVDINSRVMTEEIFGPILPILTFEKMEDAISIINKNKNPLAFYLFTQSRSKEDVWMKAVAFGGGCINNASVHLLNHNLPFGGRGTSGMGSYHGKFSFETFSHKKAVLRTPTWIDPAVKYPPYEGKLGLLKKLI